MKRISNKHTKVLSVVSEVFESTQFILMITKAIWEALDYYLVIPGAILGIIRTLGRFWLINVPNSSHIYKKYQTERRKENIRLAVLAFFYLACIVVATVGIVFLGDSLRELSLNATFIAEDAAIAYVTVEKSIRVRSKLKAKQNTGEILSREETLRKRKRIFKNIESVSRLVLTVGGILVFFGLLSGPWGMAMTVMVAGFLISRSIYESVRAGIEFNKPEHEAIEASDIIPLLPGDEKELVEKVDTNPEKLLDESELNADGNELTENVDTNAEQLKKESELIADKNKLTEKVEHQPDHLVTNPEENIDSPTLYPILKPVKPADPVEVVNESNTKTPDFNEKFLTNYCNLSQDNDSFFEKFKSEIEAENNPTADTESIEAPALENTSSNSLNNFSISPGKINP